MKVEENVLLSSLWKWPCKRSEFTVIVVPRCSIWWKNTPVAVCGLFYPVKSYFLDHICVRLLIYAYGVWECKEHLDFKGQLGRWGQKIEHGSHPGCKPLMQVCQERATLFSVFFPTARVSSGSPRLTDKWLQTNRQSSHTQWLRLRLDTVRTI